MTLPKEAADAELVRNLPEAGQLLRDVLARRGWSVREGQLVMAEEMFSAFEHLNSDGMMASAPVGTGKTLGYLIGALPTNRRIIVTTSTLSLQDQIVSVELPKLAADLKELYGYDLTYAVMKGKSHYPCMSAARAFLDGESDEDMLFDFSQVTSDDRAAVESLVENGQAAIDDHSGRTRFDADTALKNLPSGIRRSVSAGQVCGVKSGRWWIEDEDNANDWGDPLRLAQPVDTVITKSTCVWRSAYAHAMKADIIVMSTALFVAEVIKSNNCGPLTPQQIPGSGVVVVDEAHHLTRAVTDAMSNRLDFDEIEDTIKTYTNRVGKIHDSADLSVFQSKLDEAQAELVDIIDNTPGLLQTRYSLASRLRDLYGELLALALPYSSMPQGGGGSDDPVKSAKRLTKAKSLLEESVFEPLQTAATMIATTVDAKDASGNPIMVTGEEGGTPRPRKEVSYDATFTGGDEDPDTGRPEPLAFDLVPLDLSFFAGMVYGHQQSLNEYMEASLLSRVPLSSGIALSSGTLSPESGPVIGMTGAEYVPVPSPFDTANIRFCVPYDMPNLKASNWFMEAWAHAAKAITATGGRTLLITTSNRMLTMFADKAERDFQGKCQVLAQDRFRGTRAELIDAFASDEHSVLVGTLSFWEGIDVPGPGLSQVIMDKMPFPMQDDPAFNARRKFTEKSGGNPFIKVDVDHVSVMLAQGVGRGQRAESDVVGALLLDNRIVKSPKRGGGFEPARYKNNALSLLPADMHMTEDFHEYLAWLKWVNPDTRSGARPQPDPSSWYPVRPRRRARGRGSR